MKLEKFNQILLNARENRHAYKDPGLWIGIVKLARSVADKYIPAAFRAEREDAASHACVKLIRLYQKKRKLGVDIFDDYSAEHLYRCVCRIACFTAIDCFKSVCTRQRYETSLSAPVACDGDELTLGDTLTDTKTLAPDETALARSVIRKAIDCADLATLVCALDIKRGEFGDRGVRCVSAEKFADVVAKHLGEIADRKTTAYCAKLLALGTVDLTKLYNKIYNDNRKRRDGEDERILTLKPDTDDD